VHGGRCSNGGGCGGVGSGSGGGGNMCHTSKNNLMASSLA